MGDYSKNYGLLNAKTRTHNSWYYVEMENQVHPKSNRGFDPKKSGDM